MLYVGILASIGLDPRGVTCGEDSNAQVSKEFLKRSNLVIKELIYAYL